MNKLERIKQIMASITDKTLDELLEYAFDDDDSIRLTAVENLSMFSDKEAAKNLLIKLTSDKDYEMRKVALESLSRFSGDDVFEAITSRLKDLDWLVRITAVELLSSFGATRSSSYLELALKDKNEFVRGTAAEALGRLNVPNAISALEEGIKREHRNWARLGYYVGLCLSGQRNYLDSIIRLLKNKSYRLRCAAASSLVELVNNENKSRILEALQASLKRENTIAVKSSIEEALALLTDDLS